MEYIGDYTDGGRGRGTVRGTTRLRQDPIKPRKADDGEKRAQYTPAPVRPKLHRRKHVTEVDPTETPEEALMARRRARLAEIDSRIAVEQDRMYRTALGDQADRIAKDLEAHPEYMNPYAMPIVAEGEFDTFGSMASYLGIKVEILTGWAKRGMPTPKEGMPWNVADVAAWYHTNRVWEWYADEPEPDEPEALDDPAVVRAMPLFAAFLRAAG